MNTEIVQNNQNGKDLFFQCVRGICIIAVILIHCKSGKSYQGTVSEINFYYWICLRQIINFAVSVFLFLSGYFVNGENVNKAPLDWIRKRFIRLYLPFLVWALIYTIVKLHKQLDLSFSSFSRLALGTLTGYYSTHLYYIFILIQLTLLTPFLLRKKTARIGFIIICIIFYVCRYLAYFLELNYFNKIWKFCFPCFGLFYILGIEWRHNGLERIKNIKISFCIIFFVLTLLLSFGESFLLLQLGVDSDFIVSQVKISSVFFSFSVICFLLKLHTIVSITKSNNLFVIIGNNSFSIYFIHLLILYCINMVLKILNIYDLNVLIIIHIIELSLSLSLLFSLLFKKIRRGNK